MDQYIGKMLDNRYEILERIGTGGMAVVYKAKCHRLNRLVAIKILKSDLAQDADFRRRFNAESQAVAQLSHPNIVSVYDVSRGGELEYIVMELIDGITLKQYMEKRGQLNWRESLHFITQIMRGLSHAHSRGIIHRDIKPQNVMVLRDGSVKVADFGIACLENASQTLTQEALGSVHYISPEQARGDRTDARSDIYSAGVVLYEMLAGRLPFEGDSAVSVAIQHLSSIPLAPREINPDIPEQLELICLKAMASDIDRRYVSADAMIADLEAFRKNPGVSLDFELVDLRPEVEDEPTMPLRNSGSLHNAARTSHERERRREHEPEPAPEHRGGKIALITCVTIAALVVVFFLFRSIFGSFTTPVSEQYRVPNVVGMTVEQAQSQKEVADGTFVIEEVAAEFSDYAVGQIIRQDPKAYENKKGELPITIQVWVSAGEDTGAMIDVTNLTLNEAIVRLRDLKSQYDLTLDEREEYRQYSDTINEGYVISTEPAANEPLKKGDTIKIVLSKGPETEPVTVITFTKLDIEQVKKQLEEMGLVLGSVNPVESEEAAGTVLEQSIPALTVVDAGTTINFTVSSGPAVKTETMYPLIIPLPTDRSVAHLQVLQDGGEVFNDTVSCDTGNQVVELYGSGTAMIDIYIDGEYSALSGEISFEDG